MRRAPLTLLAGTLFVCLAAGAAAARERPQGVSSENASRTIQGVRVVGILKDQGVTSHMYGSHTIRDRSTGRLYALRSRQAGLLDRYAGKLVAVYGMRVRGFPIGPGPPLLEVYRVSARPPLSCPEATYDPTVRCPVW